ncbi:uncharacterized protein LOC143470760 [Clavelina lepadiformis]|uniref:uncharacterized protein LOC143470760 n=1 Tax=Clavelina lepadiformis TaxID=159417 RepID=UPI0040433571
MINLVIHLFLFSIALASVEYLNQSGSAADLPASCKQIKLAGRSHGNVIYYIRDSNMISYPVYCDMTLGSGGWTLVASIHENKIRNTGGEVFSEPAEYDAVNGALNLKLPVQMKDFKVEWLTMVRRTYNGEIPAPTWKIRKGDRVNLKLVNNLELPQKVLPLNKFRLPNTTNIHTHGLHISGEEPQDNVFVDVGPGQSYNYYYQINEDQPAGTFWYHPHLHGNTLFQVL